MLVYDNNKCAFFITLPFLQQTSETFSITLSQKTDSLFIMVTHYYLKHVNKVLWKIQNSL